jgi:hypothetical protein
MITTPAPDRVPKIYLRLCLERLRDALLAFKLILFAANVVKVVGDKELVKRSVIEDYMVNRPSMTIYPLREDIWIVIVHRKPRIGLM